MSLDLNMQTLKDAALPGVSIIVMVKTFGLVSPVNLRSVRVDVSRTVLLENTRTILTQTLTCTVFVFCLCISTATLMGLVQYLWSQANLKNPWRTILTVGLLNNITNHNSILQWAVRSTLLFNAGVSKATFTLSVFAIDRRIYIEVMSLEVLSSCSNRNLQ